MHRDNIDEIRKLFIGLDNKIVINGKKQVIPINFDNAATTPVLKKVMRAVLKASENYDILLVVMDKNHSIVVIYMKNVEGML